LRNEDGRNGDGRNGDGRRETGEGRREKGGGRREEGEGKRQVRSTQCAAHREKPKNVAHPAKGYFSS
jgi:hypothetical protein